MVKPEGWGARDRSSIPDVDSLQNADIHRCVFKFDARSLKPGLHIVGSIAEHACDDASKNILKLSIYRLKIIIVKYLNL